MKLKQIWAIALRDLSMKHRWWKDLLALLVVFIVIFGIGEGITLMMPQSNDKTYSMFFVSGMIFYMIAITALAVGIDIVIDRKGFNKILLIAPMPRISIIIGKLVYLCIAVLKNYLIFGIILMLYFNSLTFTKIFLSVILMIATALIYIGISYAISGIIKTRTGAETALSILTIGTLLLSGLFYSITQIPTPIRYLFYINPGVYLADMFRYILIGQYTINPVTNALIISVLGIVLTFGGIKLFEYRLRKYGI